MPLFPPTPVPYRAQEDALRGQNNLGRRVAELSDPGAVTNGGTMTDATTAEAA